MKLKIKKDIHLAEYTTFKIGGYAEYFTEVSSVAGLVEAVGWAKENNLLVTVLGSGSNVLVSDRGITGLVIKNSIQGIQYSEDGDKTILVVGAGVIFDDMVTDVIGRGLWGIENLSAIPGTVGAAPIQNIGAYGVEIKESILEVEVYDREAEVIKTFTNTECNFGYRDSIFKKSEAKKYIVTKVVFVLSKSTQRKLHYKDLQEYFNDNREPSLTEIREAVISIRAKKFPDLSVYGTAGSFFKNPIISKERYSELQNQYPNIPSFEAGEKEVKIPLGWILDNVLHLKGSRMGDIGLFENQALVVINYDNGTSKNVEDFISSIEQQVKSVCGIDIEREVTVLK